MRPTARSLGERRQSSAAESGYTGVERRVADRREDTGLERRRGPGRRRTDDRRSAEEGEMTIEQFEFVMAIQTYKKLNRRMFSHLDGNSGSRRATRLSKNRTSRHRPSRMSQSLPLHEVTAKVA